MTNKEAIKMLDRIRDEGGWTNDAYNSLTLAIEALEKQIPKKPNYVQYDGNPKIGNYHCPACEKILELEPIDHNEKVFCLHCGQAIDWSEGEYKELIEKLRKAGRWIKHDDGSEETYLLSVNDCAEIADAIEQLIKERDAYYMAIEGVASLSNFCVGQTKFYITSEDIYSEEVALRLKAEKERDELCNELCLRCGEYTEAHNGACDGCKWRVTDD